MRTILLDRLAYGPIMDPMSSKCELTTEKKRRFRVDALMTDEENLRFTGYLAQTGRKAGPYVRTLILKAMDEEGARNPDAQAVHP